MAHYILGSLGLNGRFQTATKLSEDMAVAYMGFINNSLFQASIDVGRGGDRME